MIETELKKILEITELTDKVFIYNAPKTTHSPYCIYTPGKSEEEYILDGVTGNRKLQFDINIYSKDPLLLQTIKYKVKDVLLSLLGTTQGAFYIQMSKVYMSDFYDSSVDMNRTAIDLEIYI